MNTFRLQPHQAFLKSAVPYLDRFLLFHGLGSGKTCSAISLAAGFSGPRKIIVVVPASLRENFDKELRGPCGLQTDPRRFDVMSYQGFVKRYKNNQLQLNDTMVIVDEVQNIISETGSMYKVFMDAFQNMNSKLVLLSATPMFDKATEIALLGNLLLTKKEYDSFHLPVNSVEFSRIMKTNPKVMYTFFKNRVSYFRGADPRAYPRKTEHHVNCDMSAFQRKAYMEIIGHIALENLNKKIERAFLINPRQVSNLVLPTGHIGKLNNVTQDFDVQKYSTKFYKCIRTLQSSPGPVFVYSNFVSIAGVDAFAQILSKVYGYSQVTLQTAATPRLRYGVFRANQPDHNKKLLTLYNLPENRDGSIVKVILGSPAMKEGVTLLRTRQIHLLDPYWNRSRTEQIIGRGVRFRSHADLPADARHVDVFHYYAVPSKEEHDVSVDLRILALSEAKIHKINILETILKETAFDCPVFKAYNEPPSIPCFEHGLVSNEERNRLLTRMNNKPTPQKIATKRLPPPKTQPVNINDGMPVDPVSIAAPELQKIKPMRFGKYKILGGLKEKRVRSSCPKARRPDNSGVCPAKYPYLLKNKKGDPCCFARKPKTTETVVKTCPPDKVYNPRTKRCVKRTSRLGKLLV